MIECIVQVQAGRQAGRHETWEERYVEYIRSVNK
jgi:hypothetical protein